VDNSVLIPTKPQAARLLPAGRLPWRAPRDADDDACAPLHVRGDGQSERRPKLRIAKRACNDVGHCRHGIGRVRICVAVPYPCPMRVGRRWVKYRASSIRRLAFRRCCKPSPSPSPHSAALCEDLCPFAKHYKYFPINAALATDKRISSKFSQEPPRESMAWAKKEHRNDVAFSRLVKSC
jgi:hypothetical protein